MDIDRLWDSRKFHQKLDNLASALKKKNLSDDDKKDYVAEFLEAALEFSPAPVAPVDAVSKVSVPAPEPIDHLQILLEAKKEGKRDIFIPHIAQSQLIRLWQEAKMGWTPQFQAVNGGWRVADDFMKLQAGKVG